MHKCLCELFNCNPQFLTIFIGRSSGSIIVYQNRVPEYVEPVSTIRSLQYESARNVVPKESADAGHQEHQTEVPRRRWLRMQSASRNVKQNCMESARNVKQNRRESARCDRLRIILWGCRITLLVLKMIFFCCHAKGERSPHFTIPCWAGNPWNAFPCFYGVY